jgi:hypothetical protein
MTDQAYLEKPHLRQQPRRNPLVSLYAEVIKNLKAVKQSVAQLAKQKADVVHDDSSGLFSKTSSEATAK